MMKRVINFMLLIVALLASVGQASAGEIAIQPIVLQGWNDRRTGVELWIFSSEDWVDATGIPHGAGSAHSNRVWTQRVTGLTVDTNARTLSIPGFNLMSTRDAMRSPHVKYSFWIMTSSGGQIAIVPGTANGLQVPATITSAIGCAPVGSCAHWSDLIRFNNPLVSVPIDQSTYTRGEVDRLITTNVASFVPPGAAFVTRTPDSVLTNETALSALGTGLLKNNTGSGVLSVAVAGTDYEPGLTFSSPLSRAGNTVSVTGSNLTVGTNLSITGGTGALLGGTPATISLGNQVPLLNQANIWGAFNQRFQAGANFSFVDPTDTTKTAQFNLSGIASGNTRLVVIPDAASATAQAKAVTANQFLTSFDATTGAFSAAQPSFANLSGTATAGQLPATAVNSVVNDTNITGSIAGQALTLGWTGALSPARGGTGVNNNSSTFTIAGGFNLTATLTGNTNVSLPTTGTLVNTAVTTLSDLAAVGTITTGTWTATAIATQFGGTGQNWSASSGVPSFNAGTASLNAVTANGIAFGGASSALSFTGAANNAVLVTSGAGTPSLSAPGASLVVSGSTLDTVQAITTASTPRFAGLGINTSAPSAGLRNAGLVINTDADQTVASAEFTATVIKDDANSRTFPVVRVRPTFNTGPSNSATTINVLDVDTVNTAATGLTVNLVRASYGGAEKWRVDSTGAGVLATSLSIAGGAALTTTNQTGTGSLVMSSAPTVASPTLTSPTITVGSDATGDIYYRNSGGAVARLSIGSTNQVLTVIGGLPSWQAAGAGSTHTLLSHLDATTASAVRGDVVSAQGTGTPTWTRLALGAANRFLGSNGTDLVYQQVSLTAGVTGALPVANGGTGATTLANNGVLYGAGTGAVQTVVGGAGTLCLQSTDGAAPVFGACSGSAATAWSALTAPSSNLSLAMGANTSVFTFGNATGAGADMFTVRDTASNTGTGHVMTLNTATGSAAKPLLVAAGGTSNGVEMSTAGVLAAIGTGGITATDGDSATAFFSAGTLEAARLPATAVLTDQANTYSTGVQDFGSATAVKVPTSAGAAPTASGRVAYDSTANVFVGGANGATKTFLFTDGSGASLINLNASNIASGTLVDARLSTNVPLLNAVNVFTVAGGITADNQNGVRLREASANGTNYVELRAAASMAANVTYTYPSADAQGFFRSDGSGTLSLVGETGSGNVVRATSPSLTTPVFASITNSGTLTLPTSTDTLTGRATTDTFTNKTLDAEASGNVITVSSKIWIDAAGGTAANPAANWDLPASSAPTAALVAGTNSLQGVLDFADGASDLTAQRVFRLPGDWAGNVDVAFKWLSATTSGNVVWGVSTSCVADAETNDPAFNSYNDVTDTTKGTANQTNDASVTGITMTGCAAGELLHIRIARRLSQAGDTLAGTARLIGVEMTLRRAQ